MLVLHTSRTRGRKAPGFYYPEPRTPNLEALLPDSWLIFLADNPTWFRDFARTFALVFGLFFAYNLLVNHGGFNNGKNQ